jgi:hypothetical protein
MTAREEEEEKGKIKGKAVPIQAWTGPEGSSSLRLTDFKTLEGGNVVSHTHQPSLPPRKYSWNLFQLGSESTPGP